MNCNSKFHKCMSLMFLAGIASMLLSACSSPSSDADLNLPKAETTTVETEAQSEETQMEPVDITEEGYVIIEEYDEDPSLLQQIITEGGSEAIEEVKNFAKEIASQAPIYSRYLEKSVTFPVCVKKSRNISSAVGYTIINTYALNPTGLARKTDRGEIDEQLVITETDVFTVDDYLRTIYHTSLSDGEITFYANAFLADYLPRIVKGAYTVEHNTKELRGTTYDTETIKGEAVQIDVLYEGDGEPVYILVNGWEEKVEFCPMTDDPYLLPDGYNMEENVSE